MRLTIILVLAPSSKDNVITCESLYRNLRSCRQRHEILVRRDRKAEESVEKILSSLPSDIIFFESSCDSDGLNDAQIYRDASGSISGDYVTMLFGGDTLSDSVLRKAETQDGTYAVFMTRKKNVRGRWLALSSGVYSKVESTLLPKKRVDLNEILNIHPFYLGGTFVKKEFFTADRLHLEYGLEAEREYFLSLCLQEMKLYLLPGALYTSVRGREGQSDLFPGNYKKEYYTDSLSRFWFPFLSGLAKRGPVPAFIQANFMFSVKARFNANKNNQNKHVLSEEEVKEFYRRLSELFLLIDDQILFNSASIPALHADAGVFMFYGILKYGKSFRFTSIPGKTLKGEDARFLAAGGSSKGITEGPVQVQEMTLERQSVSIAFMDWHNGILHIDASIGPVLYYISDRIIIEYDGKEYSPCYDDRYALTKFFGISAFKAHTFYVDLPLEGRAHYQTIRVIAMIDKQRIPLKFSYRSYYSRMSAIRRMSHWCFGNKKEYLMTNGTDRRAMKISHANAAVRFLWETLLLLNMFFSFHLRDWLFIAVRLTFHIVYPFMKRKKIWLYFDKIYKAGDSSEYLYKYASKINDPDIVHYYLVEKNCPDYHRLINEGYTPLVRKSVKHRLVFLLADMMIISNSTAYTFNNFGRINASYVKDLIDSHAVCVQHGMSVQKIAVAQQRLRDNTRLYFCASKYEIENLSKPVYGYTGVFAQALKLTGVPRHDGLIDRHTKQILISPTWRMQAALEVRTDEGEKRDYNPLFKMTSYFKVYNRLINDPGLLSEARTAGYKIKYVLHPIVSVQLKDFQSNDVAEIVPSTGNMSYEDMFCESALMVTDYSGVQFDFAYMRKPVLYLHSDEIPAHYEEGTFHYDTMAFGEIAHTNDELIALLISYMQTGCHMKDEYVRRADDFFAFSDHQNCKRVYDTMIEYQNEYIHR